MAPNTVEAKHMNGLSKHFSERQVIEVVAVISLFGFLNRWNDTMAITLENSPKSLQQPSSPRRAGMQESMNNHARLHSQRQPRFDHFDGEVI
jgi:hypothetical protein